MSSPRIERKLAAIMFTDIVGFTKIMGDDETTALSILENQQSLVNPIIKEHKGTIIKKMGDGLLIEFPSTVEAVECATQMQNSIKTYNSSDGNLEFHIRIGIHLGDVVILGDDILGDGVNIASRIEPLASPDGICITDAVYKSVKSKLKLDAKRIDEVELKHIDDKYTIYKLPNIDHENDVIDNDSSFLKDKIQINNIEKMTDFRYLIFSAFKLSIVKYIMLPLLIFTFFEDSIKVYSNYSHLLAIKSSIAFAIYFLLFFPLTLGRIRYKISFIDIRKVIPTLDNIIINDWFNGKYKRVKNKNNQIQYINRGLPVFNKFLEKINCVPTLDIKVDGNTLEIEGLFFKTISTIRNIKKVSLIK